ncbi:MAG: hypothetical protein ACYSU1_04380 [Planctomycetota bacterium]
MLLSTLCLCLPAVAQEPPADLQQSLAADDVAMRFEAARELAVGDERAEKWLLREAGKGTEQRQRALLLASALMGTEASFAVLEHASRRGRKPDPQRAFSLLLYGQFHPQAGLQARSDWERCASDFERACLLTGMLARPERLQVGPWKALVQKRKQPALTTLLQLSERLTGNRMAEVSDTRDAASFSASLLASVDSRQPHLQGEILGVRAPSDFPAMWWLAAPRQDSRPMEDLRRQALVGQKVGFVLTLYEVAPAQRQALFDHYRQRAVGPVESAWLWGAAGDLGLALPGPETDVLHANRVAGILRLARKDFVAAESLAMKYLPAARSGFRAATHFEQRWPAAVVLALGRQQADLELLKTAFQQANGTERHRLAPIWKFANRGFSTGDLRGFWLDAWSRTLGAGWQGYLDVQGPRWAAYLLAGGSLAAENQNEIATPFLELESLPKDYAADHVLYRDLVDFLLGGDYRWNS